MNAYCIDLLPSAQASEYESVISNILGLHYAIHALDTPPLHVKNSLRSIVSSTTTATGIWKRSASRLQDIPLESFCSDSFAIAHGKQILTNRASTYSLVYVYKVPVDFIDIPATLAHADFMHQFRKSLFLFTQA